MSQYDRSQMIKENKKKTKNNNNKKYNELDYKNNFKIFLERPKISFMRCLKVIKKILVSYIWLNIYQSGT